MPTWEALAPFWADLGNLTPRQRAAFQRGVAKFVADLHAGQFRAGLRVKKMQGHESIWEMTWAPDGRATFEYGKSVQDGEVHIVWRRVGTHDVFDRP
ncbi:MAG: hypothetical protein QOJ50_1025 [Cryptosporangiaceae bacterium]|nr:hypothetical protein [Cryptosporangiaceae bacterium]